MVSYQTPSACAIGASPPELPTVDFHPAEIVKHQTARWRGVQVKTVQLISHEPFEYSFKQPCHLLVAVEQGVRYDGETFVEGLPTSTVRNYSHKLIFVPAGRRFFGAQSPRLLTRSLIMRRSLRRRYAIGPLWRWEALRIPTLPPNRRPPKVALPDDAGAPVSGSGLSFLLRSRHSLSSADGKRRFHPLGRSRTDADNRCEPCGRRGRYNVARLMAKYGNVKILYLLAELASCPKTESSKIYDRCKARYEGLSTR